MVKRIKPKPVFVLTILLTLTTPYLALAENYHRDKVLTFDPIPNTPQSLYFDLDNPLIPTPSDFKVLSTAFMSNNLGERWALITVENTSSSQRLLKNKNIVVTFADGKQRYAQNLDETLRGKETLSKAIYFGIYQFPIVMIKFD